MEQYGLLGFPLGHSLSPFIHKCLFEIIGRSCAYGLYALDESSLCENIGSLMSLSGFNVTIPHKINIIKYLSSLDEKAALFGAVNTVKTGNSPVGYNTDCIGFERALEGAGIALSGKTLLCGTGGAARMAAFEAVLHGCALTLAYRQGSESKAEKIQSEIHEKLNQKINICEYRSLECGWDLVINATSAGMLPNVHACAVDKRIIQSAGAAYDIVYNPKETLFLKYAAEAGIKRENGLSMLVWQAAAAQEIWTGAEFSAEDIETVIRKTEKELLKR